MEPSTWTLLAALFAVAFYYLYKRSRYFDELGIPYVTGWPLLGNMGPVLFRRRHFSDVIVDIYRSHPTARYVGAFDFIRPIVVLRDLELIKSIGINRFDNFSDHSALMDESVDPVFGGNLMNITGEKWKETRNLLSPSFTSSKMKAMYGMIVECAKNLNDHLLQRSRSSSLTMIDTKDLFTKYAMDSILVAALGLNVDTLKNPKNDFYVLGREATSLEGLQGVKFRLARAFPRLIKALRIKFVSERVAGFFRNVVATTVRTRDEMGISRPDMLQLMMDARGKMNSKNLILDIPTMTAQAFVFFFGGLETNSTQMCIIAHELAINRDIQRRLQDEIDEVMERTGGEPKYEDVMAMAYLDAVFNESMRRHAQGSWLDRVCTKAFELPPALPGGKPYVVQPGSTIWIPVAGIHSDPEYYEDPDKFDPNRYYGKKVTINDVTNLGFGIGPRGCIGYRFAIMEIKILFFFLLSRFNLVPNSKTTIPLVYSKNSVTIQAEGGYWLAIEPRSDHSKGTLKS